MGFFKTISHLVVLAGLTCTAYATESKLCNGKVDPGESPDMGPQTFVVWVALSAFSYRHCGFPRLNYQPMFDRMLKSGPCKADTTLGKQFQNANRKITTILDEYSDEQYVNDNLRGRDGVISYDSGSLLDEQQTKKSFCTKVHIGYNDTAACLKDEIMCSEVDDGKSNAGDL